MKKLFFILAIVIGMMTVASCQCSKDSEFGVEYSINSTGETDGSVELAFVDGDIKVSGDANYSANWSNTIFAPRNGIPTLEEGLICTYDKDSLSAALYLDEWFANNFEIVDYSGTYDIYIKGYVKETLTGFTFSIDRHFTNKIE